MVSPAERYRVVAHLMVERTVVIPSEDAERGRFAPAKPARLFNDDQAMGLATIRQLAAPCCACGL